MAETPAQQKRFFHAYDGANWFVVAFDFSQALNALAKTDFGADIDHSCPPVTIRQMSRPEAEEKLLCHEEKIASQEPDKRELHNLTHCEIGDVLCSEV